MHDSNLDGKTIDELLDELRVMDERRQHILDHLQKTSERISSIIAKYRTTEPDSLLAKSIDELELTTRTANNLKAEGIHIIRDLLERSEADLLRIPNMGRRNVSEIKEVLASRDLKLRET